MVLVSVRGVKTTTASGKIVSGHDKEERDTFEMSKENLLNCSPYSLFETHSGRGSTEGVRSKAGGEAQATRSTLHPRKRSLSESRLSAPPSTTRGRELSPPELTTSDNFKPAKRVLGPKLALQEKKKLPPVKVGLPSSPAAPSPSSAKTLPRFSTPLDTRNPDSRSSKVGVSTRKTSLTGRRLSVVRVSVTKEKGVFVSAKDAVKEKVKETTKKVMVFSAKKSDQETVSTVAQTGVERARSRVAERKAAPIKSPIPSGKPPSRPVKPGAPVKDESTAKSRVVARQSDSTKAMAESIRTRKLSLVLQSEQRLQEQNHQLELQLKQLQEELVQKDHEIERLRTAGLILNNLANSQSDEVRNLKIRLKETFNENAEVRDICEKLEKEREEAHAARKMSKEEEQNSKALEAQLAPLTAQLQSMAVGVPQQTFEVHRQDQVDLGSKIHADDAESEAKSEAGRVPQWSAVIDEVTEEVPLYRHPEVSPRQEMSAVGHHEELLAAIRAVQDVHDAEDNVLSDSMRNELEVIEGLQNALTLLKDLHPAAEALLIR